MSLSIFTSRPKLPRLHDLSCKYPRRVPGLVRFEPVLLFLLLGPRNLSRTSRILNIIIAPINRFPRPHKAVLATSKDGLTL
jgi:hypothetical protein